MGLSELLTIVFIILKLTGVIEWSWWILYIAYDCYIRLTVNDDIDQYDYRAEVSG